MASVASTYARAFADVVLSKKLDAQRATGELRQIAELLAESADLRRVWENPAIPAEQKRGLLDAIAQRGGIEKAVRNLVAVIQQLEKELDARLGFAEAQITSVRELADAEKRGLETEVAKLTGKKVRAKFGQDASLLGGVVVRIGSTVYDGSVKGQLEKIREAISS